MKWLEWLEKQEAPIKASVVARIMGITPAQVYKLAKAGKIPGAMRLSRKALRFCPAAFLPWIRSQINGHGNLADVKKAY
jgi:predicted DNA-binding transcriptional regulator AlpA